MRLIFFIISMAYIVAIFLFAGSPVVSDLAPFNPYSLLHIPLFGILTALLIFSFVAIKPNGLDVRTGKNGLNGRNGLNGLNVPKVPNGPNVLNEPNGPNDPNVLRMDASTLKHTRFFLACAIALIVAIVDEIHQSSIPARNASVTDVFLDAIGTALALLIILKLYKKKKSLTISQ